LTYVLHSKRIGTTDSNNCCGDGCGVGWTVVSDRSHAGRPGEKRNVRATARWLRRRRDVTGHDGTRSRTDNRRAAASRRSRCCRAGVRTRLRREAYAGKPPSGSSRRRRRRRRRSPPVSGPRETGPLYVGLRRTARTMVTKMVTRSPRSLSILSPSPVFYTCRSTFLRSSFPITAIVSVSRPVPAPASPPSLPTGFSVVTFVIAMGFLTHVARAHTSTCRLPRGHTSED
jgi:hypothetical protein